MTLSVSPTVLGAARLARIRQVEAQWGRHGIWCATCRARTPVEQLYALPAASVLFCETCSAELLVAPLPRAAAGRSAAPRR